MTVSNSRVVIDSPFVKQQLKEAKLGGQVVMAVCGYKSPSIRSWDKWLRNGSLPNKVALYLMKLGFELQRTHSK